MGEGGAQHVGDAEGADDQTAQLGKDGTGGVGLVVGLVAAALAPHDAGLFEPAELALGRAEAEAKLAHEFSEIEGLIGAAQEAGEQYAAGAAEEEVHDSGISAVRTHNEFNCIIFGYERPGAMRFEYGAQKAVAGLWAGWLTFRA